MLMEGNRLYMYTSRWHLAVDWKIVHYSRKEINDKGTSIQCNNVNEIYSQITEYFPGCEAPGRDKACAVKSSRALFSSALAFLTDDSVVPSMNR